MPCIHTEDVSALLDGELSEEEAVRLRGHIDVCPECGAEYASLLQLSRMFRAARVTAPSIGESRPLSGVRRGVAIAALVTIGVSALLGLSSELRDDELRFEAYLERSLDEDVFEVSSLSEDDLSRDRIVGLLISSAH